jgi:hypothetical protein
MPLAAGRPSRKATRLVEVLPEACPSGGAARLRRVEGIPLQLPRRDEVVVALDRAHVDPVGDPCGLLDAHERMEVRHAVGRLLQAEGPQAGDHVGRPRGGADPPRRQLAGRHQRAHVREQPLDPVLGHVRGADVRPRRALDDAHAAVVEP